MRIDCRFVWHLPLDTPLSSAKRITPVRGGLHDFGPDDEWTTLRYDFVPDPVLGEKHVVLVDTGDGRGFSMSGSGEKLSLSMEWDEYVAAEARRKDKT
jgi:hypothetical protein